MPREDHRANWSKGRGISMVLVHFKIIGARNFTKIKADHEITNFRMFLTYGALEKIVLDIKTWRGGNLSLIWPFWTQWQNCFVTSKYRL